ncbi:CubicO group peptidase, beta-lactamase class C family [Nannocystis exedens]|uniref:CubicO group peptidase, beta-lactamase class C family n=1 Tax=Nannocystis exedens TaxID=54 RepID=A0A1I2DEI3_9BACT|nr:serine hydrolase domain-containing protein [Nannocystis exedens]PCC70556.1 serine hydrolase [Nannocystis exedens]SFE78924.1 CubicO group peptidase, beta-lactamase class C family [Nannocystis exedens]
MNHASLLSADLRARQVRRRALAVLLFVLFVFGAALGGPVEPAGHVLDESALVHATTAAPPIEVEAPPTLEQLQARVAAVLAREGVPGVGLALVDRNGVRWAGGVGVADRSTGAPVGPDTQFRVASITKSFVALGVMRLVEQGRLDLNRPLRELMPDVALGNDWDATSPITLAHALEHTAGFDEMRFNEYWGEDGAVPREALAINPRSRVARWRPGSRMSYSNPGYTLAGHAIELATGESYETFLEREVLRPLGMPTARFRRTDEYADRLATGYHEPDRPAEFRPIYHAPAGALLASPRELGQLVHFWLRRGETGGPAIVGPESLARIERTETLSYPGADNNYGLGNYGDVLHPARGRGHDGGLPGFLSCYRYFPELGVGYVMLLNSTHSLQAYLEIRALLFGYLTGGRTVVPPPPVEPDPGAIAALTGYYGYANPRVELFGFIERAMLGISVRPDPAGIDLRMLTGESVQMVSTGDGGFRHWREGGTSVRLTRGDDGRRILVGGMAYFEEGSYAWARARLLLLGAANILLQLAPVWALGWAVLAVIRRLRGRAIAAGEFALHAWPAAAGLAWGLLPLLFVHMARAEAYTTANPRSVGVCVGTVVFAACSAAAVAEVVRAGVARTVPLGLRLVPSAAAIAGFGMTLYLMFHGVIGLRIWAW